MTGTPKTLNKALENAFVELGYLSSERDIQILQGHVKDFLAQKFCSKMIQNPECSEMLRILFKSLVI
jgi:hypothetical protein